MHDLAMTSHGIHTLVEGDPMARIYVATYTGVSNLGGIVTGLEFRLPQYPHLVAVFSFHTAQWNRLKIGPTVSLSGGIYRIG